MSDDKSNPGRLDRDRKCLVWRSRWNAIAKIGGFLMATSQLNVTIKWLDERIARTARVANTTILGDQFRAVLNLAMRDKARIAPVDWETPAAVASMTGSMPTLSVDLL